MYNQPISSPQKWLAWLVSFGIGLDNAINSYYYLNLEHWSALWITCAAISSFLLNGLLYLLGAEQVLADTYQKIRKYFKNIHLNNPQSSLLAILHECIAIGSAITMMVFTLKSYFYSPIPCPTPMIWLFGFCYFLGTYTLLIQACRRPILKPIMALNTHQKCCMSVLLTVLILATSAAGCQWLNGIYQPLLAWGLIGQIFALFCWTMLMIGEIIFVFQVSLWLVSHGHVLCSGFNHQQKNHSHANNWQRFINPTSNLDELAPIMLSKPLITTNTTHRTITQSITDEYQSDANTTAWPSALIKRITTSLQQPIFSYFLLFFIAIFNAIGFAGITRYASPITTLLTSDCTFILGFLMSLLIMIRSITEWLTNQTNQAYKCNPASQTNNA